MSNRVNTLKVLEITPYEAENIKGRFFALHLETPDWPNCYPGQFAMLRPTTWQAEQAWAKPISICSINEKRLMFFFQVAGRGTARLAQLKPGDEVIVTGPLGSRFAVQPERPTLMLAGGMGLAPFVGYTETHPNPENLRLLFGHRLPLECYLLPECCCKLSANKYKTCNMNEEEAFYASLEEHIAETAAAKGLVLSCGPLPLLRKVQEYSLKYGVEAQVSLESRMACGVGACLGCVIQPLLDEASGKNRSAHAQAKPMHQNMPAPVCSCGPVFWVDSLKF